MKIAITGHRPHKLDGDYNLTSPLIKNIKAAIAEIVQEQVNIAHINNDDKLVFISGMALGIDTLFADMAIEREVELIAAIPFKGQEGRWTNRSKQVYENLLRQAVGIQICDINRYVDFGAYNTFSDTQFTAAKMQRRNEWMVDNCDILIAVWDGTPGGTLNCINYAMYKKPIIILHPRTLEVTYHGSKDTTIAE